MPDFTRFGRSQREQVIGQVVALPTTMFVFAAMGVLITGAIVDLSTAEPTIWDPVEARRPISRHRCGRDLDVHRRRRDAVGQHRRQRRVARQRLRQRLSAADLVPHRRPDHRHRSAS